MNQTCLTHSQYFIRFPNMKHTIETLLVSKSSFDVDATYIIYHGDAEKMSAMKDQLRKYTPSKTIHFFSVGDLLQTEYYLSIFLDASTRNYGPILILEDGCFFRPQLEEKNVESVNLFLNQHKSEHFVYHLGCVPAMMFPTNDNSHRVVCLGTHAGIYSKTFQHFVLDRKKSIQDWELFVLMHCPQYTFTVPLCYQLYHTSKPNQYWPSLNGLTFFFDRLVKLIRLDQQSEPGYTIFYIIAKLIVYILSLFAILLVWIIMNYKSVYDFIKPIRIKNKSIEERTKSLFETISDLSKTASI
jgi:hypothetical protein